MRIFCLPHAGGSASVYLKWKKYLNKNIELVPIELSGRGSRMIEPFYNSLNEGIDDVSEIIKGKIIEEEEYLIYGHSMGALMTYEVCCKFLKEGVKLPKHIFLSGRHCPFIDRKETIAHKLNDEDFKEYILSLKGTPKEVFLNKELSEIFLPIIKSDYKNIETFQGINKTTVLPIPITVLNGYEDELTEEEIDGWSKLTNKNFKKLYFEGGHFFLHNHISEVAEVINEVV